LFNGDASLRFDDIWGVVRGEGIVIIKAEGVYKILRASPFVRGESIGFGFGSHEAQGGGRFLVSNDDCQVYNTCDIPNNAFFNDGSLRVMVVRPIVGRKGISRRGSHLEVGSVSQILLFYHGGNPVVMSQVSDGRFGCSNGVGCSMIIFWCGDARSCPFCIFFARPPSLEGRDVAWGWNE
jgi:hypothetical protein